MSMDHIIVRVIGYFGISYADLQGPGRRPVEVNARGMVSVIARNITNFSYPEIGRAMGHGHTTAIYAERRMRTKIDSNTVMLEKPASEVLELLTKQITSDMERDGCKKLRRAPN